jgi:hypothetical protein
MTPVTWEYHTLKVLPGGFFGGKVDEDELLASLNRMGAAGWELVSAFDTSYGQGTSREILLILKRQR